MAKRPPDEQSKKVANSLRDLKRQMESGSARVTSAEKKLSKLIKSGGSNTSKSAKEVTNALEQTSTVRDRLLAELGNLASALESGKQRDIETGRKRVQQNHKLLADAVKRLDQSIKSGQREGDPSGATGHEDKPDLEELAREIYEELLRQLEMARQRTEDPWL
jgi:DNA anti-recombination protein RmuC